MRLPGCRGGGAEGDALLGDGDDRSDGFVHKALPAFGIAGQNQVFGGRCPEMIEITQKTLDMLLSK